MEIKHCPFCGKIDSLIVDVTDAVKQQYQIVCDVTAAGFSGCGGASGWAMSMDDAIELWNTRYEDPV